jgi:hypothetical protein
MSPSNNLVTRHVIGNQRNLIGILSIPYTLMEKYLSRAMIEMVLHNLVPTINGVISHHLV